MTGERVGTADRPRPAPAPEVIVLDAMGVMYQAGDDVAELLVPYVSAHGGAPADVVEREYLRASRGELTAAAFWRSVGLDPSHEDAYLLGHALAPDLLAFLARARRSGRALAVLSNDVSEWSRKLRRRFGLEEHVRDWIISGDVRARKPEPAIYAALLAHLGRPPEALLLVDDRERNLDAARRAGLETVLRCATPVNTAHHRVASLSELAEALRSRPSRT